MALVVATIFATLVTSGHTDAKGRAYMVLPRVNPVDCYYLHNPDSYFRME